MSSNWILGGDEHSSGPLRQEDESCTEHAGCFSHLKSGKKTAGSEALGVHCLNLQKDLGTSIISETSISCTTFNILAPIYKRVGGEGCRESQFHDAWLSRNQKILDLLLHIGSSIICLQEFWLENDELVQLYEDSLGCAGYSTHKLARTSNRGDGLLTAISTDRLKVLSYRELSFYDCGDRVAQFFYLRTKSPFHKRYRDQDLLLVNTHLLFPHDSSFCRIRLRQAHKIMEYLERFEMENGLSAVPVILCGDWNGSKQGHVYKFLRSQGFVSSYDTMHSYADNDAHKWISHCNHRGNLCGVDFIWLRNPKVQKRQSVIKKETMLAMTKDIVLMEKALTNSFPKYSDIMKCTGFAIQDAYLLPREVEQGFWPEDYTLSDHAPLTVVFEPSKAGN